MMTVLPLKITHSNLTFVVSHPPTLPYLKSPVQSHPDSFLIVITYAHHEQQARMEHRNHSAAANIPIIYLFFSGGQMTRTLLSNIN